MTDGTRRVGSRIGAEGDGVCLLLSGPRSAIETHAAASTGRGWRVAIELDEGEAIAACDVIDAIGNRNAVCITRKVVDADVLGPPAPRAPRVLEHADQFPLLGVHANDGLPALGERLSQAVDLRELPISVG